MLNSKELGTFFCKVDANLLNLMVEWSLCPHYVLKSTKTKNKKPGNNFPGLILTYSAP